MVRKPGSPVGVRPGGIAADIARYNTLADLEADDQIPDCHAPGSDAPCPLLREGLSDEERRLADDECAACLLSSEEYRDLTTWGPLLCFGLDYLRRRDVGLEIPRAELSYREEQIIIRVHQGIEAGRARRMKKKPDTSPKDFRDG